MSQQQNPNPYANFGYSAPYYPYANVNAANPPKAAEQRQTGAGYPQYPTGYQPQPQAGPSPGQPGPGGQLPLEESYIENILRLNRGKLATVYMTFEGNNEWNAKIFRGLIEAAGRDHLILSDPQTGMRYLLLMVNLDYVTFEEEIEYQAGYGGGGGMASYPPR
ncbi:spore coat protein GerQ [Peribacillus sp. SCS-155]|uniref:spore coat protein GerQ n=1 Tax=Peribacillus sedimenti TaxID=3115297 RepID=UPI003906C190